MDTLERYSMLKLIHRHGNLTRYQLMKKLRRLDFSAQQSTIYRQVKGDEKNGVLIGTKIAKDYRPVTGGKSRNGWWKKLKNQNQTVYSLTPLGIKLLFDLENRIKIALTGEIWGREI